MNPRLVRKQLPPDDDVTRRNLLYRQLFSEFDRIDIEVVSKTFFSRSRFKLVLFNLDFSVKER